MTAHIDAEACVDCGVCAQMCPMYAIVMADGKAVVEPEKCTACGVCEEECPARAISVS